MNRILTASLTALLLAGCGGPNGWRPAAPTVFRGAQASVQGLRSFLPGVFEVNGASGSVMTLGRPAAWQFRFQEPSTGAPLTRFGLNHGKAMHLIVVSRDLADFAHLHPTLRQGEFRVQANAPGEDADNLDARRAVPRPGRHLLFGEVVPTGMAPQEARFDLRAEGAEQPIPLQFDKPLASGLLQKHFTADSQPGRAGDAYRVSLKLERGEHHPGMPMLTFTFRIQAAQANGTYADVRDLVSWLGMPGHAVLIGQAGETAAERVFRHLHADHGDRQAGLEGGDHGGGHTEPVAGPTIAFMAMGDDVPPSGRYKVWGQFKHRGRILTFPFVLQL